MPAAAPPKTPSPGRGAEVRGSRPAFTVNLDVFNGPFDLLLSLITKRKLDVTEVALAEVTDEFLEYLADGEIYDLSQASEFLVVAATLLDLKAARLLPGELKDDGEDLELLEARDLLFARLLQYRAYKDVSASMGRRYRDAALSFPRSVPLESAFAALLPELIWVTSPEDLARAAAHALSRPAAAQHVETGHLHQPLVPVAAQAKIISALLREFKSRTFAQLIKGVDSRPVVVSRFLALLELYRAGQIEFEQEGPLGSLGITWRGGEENVAIHDDYGAAPEEV